MGTQSLRRPLHMQKGINSLFSRLIFGSVHCTNGSKRRPMAKDMSKGSGSKVVLGGYETCNIDVKDISY